MNGAESEADQFLLFLFLMFLFLLTQNVNSISIPVEKYASTLQYIAKIHRGVSQFFIGPLNIYLIRPKIKRKKSFHSSSAHQRKEHSTAIPNPLNLFKIL